MVGAAKVLMIGDGNVAVVAAAKDAMVDDVPAWSVLGCCEDSHG